MGVWEGMCILGVGVGVGRLGWQGGWVGAGGRLGGCQSVGGWVGGRLCWWAVYASAANHDLHARAFCNSWN